jgi:hypothetical protein
LRSVCIQLKEIYLFKQVLAAHATKHWSKHQVNQIFLVNLLTACPAGCNRLATLSNTTGTVVLRFKQTCDMFWMRRLSGPLAVAQRCTCSLTKCWFSLYRSLRQCGTYSHRDCIGHCGSAARTVTSERCPMLLSTCSFNGCTAGWLTVLFPLLAFLPGQSHWLLLVTILATDGWIVLNLPRPTYR